MHKILKHNLFIRQLTQTRQTTSLQVNILKVTRPRPNSAFILHLIVPSPKM